MTTGSERVKITAVSRNKRIDFRLAFSGSPHVKTLVTGGRQGLGAELDRCCEAGLIANRWRRCGAGTINMADPDLVTERLANRVRMILFAEREI